MQTIVQDPVSGCLRSINLFGVISSLSFFNPTDKRADRLKLEKAVSDQVTTTRESLRKRPILIQGLSIALLNNTKLTPLIQARVPGLLCLMSHHITPLAEPTFIAILDNTPQGIQCTQNHILAAIRFVGNAANPPFISSQP